MQAMVRSLARVLPFIACAFLLFAVSLRRSDAVEPPPIVPATPAAPGAPDAAPTLTAVPTGPMHVTIGLYATSIPEIDIKAATFTIDMYLWLVYSGDESIEGFEIANGEVLSKVLLERTTQGDKTYVCWRIKATMHEHFSLENYPFDRQQLDIKFEHGLLEASSLVFDPDIKSYEGSGVTADRWGLRDDVRISDYEIVRTSWQSAQSLYQTNFGSPFSDKPSSTYSTAIFSVEVARSFWPYCYKILIPLIVILAIAYLVFFLPPTEIQTASGLAMTSLLTCVAMNLTVSSNLPEVGYLVASDKFFISTYGLIFVTLAETIWTFGVATRGDEPKAERIERVFRWGFPLCVLLAFAYLGVAAAG